METIIIEPGRKPRAYLRDLWRYRDLLWLFVKRDFTTRYKQTVLGPLWHFIQPALTTAVSFLLFNVVARIPTDGIHPILFQMSGIVIWTYFAACMYNTSNTFLANAGIFGKVYFPRLISPLSVVVSQLVHFAIQFGLLLTTMAVLHWRGEQVTVGSGWWLIPLVLLIMAAMGLGLGIIVSSLTTKYRDLTVLIGFGMQLLMYLSAVNYPVSSLNGLPDRFAWVRDTVRLNPLAALVETFRNALLGGEIPWTGIGYSALWAVALLVVGIWLFSRIERTFMDTV